MKTYKLDELIDEHIGQRGSDNREAFEQKVSSYLLGQSIKNIRKQRGLSQEQLGTRIGVQKAQISRIENGRSQVRIDTILKIFSALRAEIQFTTRLLETPTSSA